MQHRTSQVVQITSAGHKEALPSISDDTARSADIRIVFGAGHLKPP